MNWQIIQDKIYYIDGSLRDIYILNTSKEDWAKWIDIVNQNYVLQFYNGQTKQIEDFIDSDAIFDFWNGKTDLVNNVTISLDTININCHFFDDREIENDIDPKEIKSIDDHIRLINYMTAISHLLDKPVILTEESSQDNVLITIDKGIITLNAS